MKQEQSSCKKPQVTDKKFWKYLTKFVAYLKYQKDVIKYDQKYSQILEQSKYQYKSFFNNFKQHHLFCKHFWHHHLVFKDKILSRVQKIIQKKITTENEQITTQDDKKGLKKTWNEQSEQLVIKQKNTEQKQSQQENKQIRAYKCSLDAQKKMTVVDQTEKEVQIQRDKSIWLSREELQQKLKTGTVILFKKEDLSSTKMIKKEQIIEKHGLSIQNIQNNYMLLPEQICLLLNMKIKSIWIGHLDRYSRKLQSVPRDIQLIRKKFISPKASDQHPDLLINQVRDSQNQINIKITLNQYYFNQHCQYNASQKQVNNIKITRPFDQPYQKQEQS